MFKGDDLGQFIKTKLAQQIQKAQIGNFVKQKGAPPIIANVTQFLGDCKVNHMGWYMCQWLYREGRERDVERETHTHR